MEAIVIIVAVLIALALVVALVRLAWWAFRMVFFIVIIFIGEAGRAWRGER
jgi:hypothetical protein